eukprot:UN22403
MDYNERWTPSYLMRIVLADANSFVDVDEEGKIIASSFTFRGDYDFNEVYGAMHETCELPLKERFVSWNNASIKLSMIQKRMDLPFELDHTKRASRCLQIFK